MNSEIENLLNYLFSLRRFGIGSGLENIKKILDRLGNPHEKLKTIHIAGTNGKGSTSHFTASILREMGFKVGLYTSPHLCRFNERILINGIEIDDEFIVYKVDMLKEFIEQNQLTFFDVTTAIAFDYFANKKVDYAVIETGLGGRLDSTNIIVPMISIICSISKDHSKVLGESIEQITYEKAGIIKPNIPVVLSKNRKEVIEIINNKCSELKSKLIIVEKEYSYDIVNNEFPNNEVNILSYCTFSEFRLNIPLYGRYQIDNVMNAIAAIENIYPNIKSYIIERGVKNLQHNFQLNGRFQIAESNPTIILDTAHNSDSIKKLLNEFNSLHFSKKFCIFGIMQDKEIDDCIDVIEEVFDEIIICQPKFERALELSKLEKKFPKVNKIKSFLSSAEALDYAKAKSCPKDAILIFGSNYLVGEVLDSLNLKKINFNQQI